MLLHIDERCTPVFKREVETGTSEQIISVSEDKKTIISNLRKRKNISYKVSLDIGDSSDEANSDAYESDALDMRQHRAKRTKKSESTTTVPNTTDDAPPAFKDIVDKLFQDLEEWFPTMEMEMFSPEPVQQQQPVPDPFPQSDNSTLDLLTSLLSPTFDTTIPFISNPPIVPTQNIFPQLDFLDFTPIVPTQNISSSLDLSLLSDPSQLDFSTLSQQELNLLFSYIETTSSPDMTFLHLTKLVHPDDVLSCNAQNFSNDFLLPNNLFQTSFC